MAAYRRVYDSRHLQADCSATLRSVIEYGLPLPFYLLTYLLNAVGLTSVVDRGQFVTLLIGSRGLATASTDSGF